MQIIRDPGELCSRERKVCLAIGMFDGVQWILFLAAHTDNHIPQLRRLSNRPNESD